MGGVLETRPRGRGHRGGSGAATFPRVAPRPPAPPSIANAAAAPRGFSKAGAESVRGATKRTERMGEPSAGGEAARGAERSGIAARRKRERGPTAPSGPGPARHRLRAPLGLLARAGSRGNPGTAAQSASRSGGRSREVAAVRSAGLRGRAGRAGAAGAASGEGGAALGLFPPAGGLRGGWCRDEPCPNLAGGSGGIHSEPRPQHVAGDWEAAGGAGG